MADIISLLEELRKRRNQGTVPVAAGLSSRGPSRFASSSLPPARGRGLQVAAEKIARNRERSDVLKQRLADAYRRLVLLYSVLTSPELPGTGAGTETPVE